MYSKAVTVITDGYPQPVNTRTRSGEGQQSQSDYPQRAILLLASHLTDFKLTHYLHPPCVRQPVIQGRETRWRQLPPLAPPIDRSLRDLRHRQRLAIPLILCAVPPDVSPSHRDCRGESQMLIKLSPQQ